MCTARLMRPPPIYLHHPGPHALVPAVDELLPKVVVDVLGLRSLEGRQRTVAQVWNLKKEAELKSSLYLLSSGQIVTFIYNKMLA